MLDDLESAGSVARGSTADIARSAIAVVVRKNAARPVFASSDSFKTYLLATKSISYADPTRGGATSVLVTKILDRLGIAAEIKAKTKLPPPGHFAVELVASGEVEAAIAQPMEALLQSGVEMAALVPPELQDVLGFTFAVGRMSVAKEPQAADALIKFLLESVVQSALKSKGMQPAAER